MTRRQAGARGDPGSRDTGKRQFQRPPMPPAREAIARGPRRDGGIVWASHKPDPDEHRTSNVEHRTSKGACASSLAFGVRRSVFGVRCSFSFRFMGPGGMFKKRNRCILPMNRHPDEHRTPNVEHRTSKGACASSLAFGVRRSVLDVRCSSPVRFMAPITSKFWRCPLPMNRALANGNRMASVGRIQGTPLGDAHPSPCPLPVEGRGVGGDGDETQRRFMAPMRLPKQP